MKIHCKYDALLNPKDLQDYPKNPNKHDDAQVERLAKLYTYHGIRHPIIVDKDRNVIAAGHGRKLAAIKAGITEFPIVYQKFETEDALYAFVTADNAIASWAELDFSSINAEISELGPDFDIDMLGIKNFEIDTADKFQGDEDEVPEPPKEPISKLGDLYELGNHRLLCGDSTSIDAVEKLMGGQKADMVFTDPPYGMNLDTNYDSMFENDSSHAKTGNRFQKVHGDDVEYDPNPIFTIQAKDYFIWGADYFYDKLPAKGSLIAWDKRDERLDNVPGNTTEFCWSKHPKRRMSIRIKWSGHHGMQRDDTKKRVHPTQKPTALAEWFFEQWGKDAKNVVDIYGGSGSTLIACEKTNRKCFMMELDPHYIDVIASRWCKFTGNTKIKRNGEEIEWPDQKRT